MRLSNCKRFIFLCFVISIASNFLSLLNATAYDVNYSKTKSQSSGTNVLSTQSKNPFYQVARELSKNDLNFAQQHHDIPLVLIGFANLLSNRKKTGIIYSITIIQPLRIWQLYHDCLL